MAGYNYMGRGGSNYDQNLTSFMTRGGYTNEQNVTSYGENGYSDRMWGPVIVDMEGRKRPVISYGPPNTILGSYVTTRTERIVEHVWVPVVVTDYNKYSSQAKVEPLKEYGLTNSSPSTLKPMRNYGVTDNNWRSSPLNVGQDRQPKVEDFITKSQTEVSWPARTGLLSAHWRSMPSSTGQVYGATSGGYSTEYAKNDNHSNNQLSRPVNEISKAVELLKDAVTNNNGRSSPSNLGQDRQPKVEDFITTAQTEVRQPARTGLLSAHWRNMPSSTGQVYGATSGGYGTEYAKNNNNQLSQPVNEISRAVELPKDVVKPSSIASAALQSWSLVPTSIIYSFTRR
ncbi:hypothetical protein Vadar_031193 [Vaccinium darrowii]|uniref:Uncharacterized protein n=1 Tax=Vaccinium darrowii TaxID=229202 RepID=A0ACB7Y4B3_9ERIC|nr:hypothetical protein Vadar_031193 [Vaccinium darrowii]